MVGAMAALSDSVVVHDAHKSGVFDERVAGDARHVVVVSSAVVYGAWPDNPVPLTEDAPLRPNPRFAIAANFAESERRALDWAESSAGRTVTLLRPSLVLGRDSDWLSQALGRQAVIRATDTVPPAQFLHVDDLKSAIKHVGDARLAGAYNVAPDGWLAGDDARQLGLGRAGVRLPARVAGPLSRLQWRVGLGGAPPEAVPYLQHPWVVANDRLRATGWQPAFTNEETLVAFRRGSWWREMSPNRRQQVALGATGAASVGAVGAAVAAIARVRARGRT